MESISSFGNAEEQEEAPVNPEVIHGALKSIEDSNEIFEKVVSAITDRYERLCAEIEGLKTAPDVQYFDEKNARIRFNSEYNKGQGRYELDQTYFGTTDNNLANTFGTVMLFENIGIQSSGTTYQPYMYVFSPGLVGEEFSKEFNQWHSDRGGGDVTLGEFLNQRAVFATEKYNNDMRMLNDLQVRGEKGDTLTEKLQKLYTPWGLRGMLDV